MYCLRQRECGNNDQMKPIPGGFECVGCKNRVDPEGYRMKNELVPVPDMCVAIYTTTDCLKIQYTAVPHKWYNKLLLYFKLIRRPTVTASVDGEFVNAWSFYKNPMYIKCSKYASHRVEIYYDATDTRWKRFKTRSLVVEEL